MSLINACRIEDEARDWASVLYKARETGDASVIKFAKEVLYPKYRDCGIGWEPAELNKELCSFFEGV